MDLFESFQFLKNHPMFRGAFLECLDIAIVKVDPATKRIEDDFSRKLRPQFGLSAESMPVRESNTTITIPGLTVEAQLLKKRLLSWPKQ